MSSCSRVGNEFDRQARLNKPRMCAHWPQFLGARPRQLRTCSPGIRAVRSPVRMRRVGSSARGGLSRAQSNSRSGALRTDARTRLRSRSSLRHHSRRADARFHRRQGNRPVPAVHTANRTTKAGSASTHRRGPRRPGCSPRLHERRAVPWPRAARPPMPQNRSSGARDWNEWSSRCSPDGACTLHRDHGADRTAGCQPTSVQAHPAFPAWMTRTP